MDDRNEPESGAIKRSAGVDALKPVFGIRF